MGIGIGTNNTNLIQFSYKNSEANESKDERITDMKLSDNGRTFSFKITGSDVKLPSSLFNSKDGMTVDNLASYLAENYSAAVKGAPTAVQWEPVAAFILSFDINSESQQLVKDTRNFRTNSARLFDKKSGYATKDAVANAFHITTQDQAKQLAIPASPKVELAPPTQAFQPHQGLIPTSTDSLIVNNFSSGGRRQQVTKLLGLAKGFATDGNSKGSGYAMARAKGIIGKMSKYEVAGLVSSNPSLAKLVIENAGDAALASLPTQVIYDNIALIKENVDSEELFLKIFDQALRNDNDAYKSIGKMVTDIASSSSPELAAEMLVSAAEYLGNSSDNFLCAVADDLAANTALMKVLAEPKEGETKPLGLSLIEDRIVDGGYWAVYDSDKKAAQTLLKAMVTEGNVESFLEGLTNKYAFTALQQAFVGSDQNMSVIELAIANNERIIKKWGSDLTGDVKTIVEERADVAARRKKVATFREAERLREEKKRAIEADERFLDSLDNVNPWLNISK